MVSRTTPRGQSEPIGVLLLLGIVLLSLVAMVSMAGGGVEDLSARTTTTLLERDVDELGTALTANVVGAQSGAATVAIRSPGTTVAVHRDVGHVRVDLGNRSVYESALGSVEVIHPDETSVIQAGAVFRGTPSGEMVVITDPSVSLRSAPLTLAFRVIVVTGNGSGSDRVTIERIDVADRYPERHIPDDSPVRITIESPQYAAWGDSLATVASGTAGTVVTDAANHRVTLQVPTGQVRYLELVVYHVRVSAG